MHGSAVPGARGCVCDCAPSPGCGSLPGSWLGLCMEEVAGHGFLGSLIPERVAGVGGARGLHPRVWGLLGGGELWGKPWACVGAELNMQVTAGEEPAS